MGEEPVGRPSTKGFSADGEKSFILRHVNKEDGVLEVSNRPLHYIVGDIVADSQWVIADDKTCTRVR